MLNFPLGTWLKRRFDSNDCAWTLPLPPWAGRREREVRRFRQLARRVLRRRFVAEHGWGKVLPQCLAWPAITGLKAWLATRISGQGNSGPSVQGHSFFDLWWVQFAHNIRIPDQQNLALCSPDQRALLGLSIPFLEHKVLMDLINRTTDRHELTDKRSFARYCTAQNLPTIEILVECDGHEIVQSQPLPPVDLILKPSDLYGGKGISALPFDADRGCWIGAEGEPLTATGVLAYSRQMQAGHPWILQRRLRNSPAWARWSTGALCTVRVVTGRLAPGGPIEVVGGFMRYPVNHAIVDNRSAGGIAADFDRETGRLGPARDHDHPWIAHSFHPDTKAAIAGEIIPAWDRVRALALRAHAPTTRFALIGWDIALPGDEPIVIELNLNWGVFVNTQLGSTPYLEIVRQWIDTPSPEVAEFLSAALKA